MAEAIDRDALAQRPAHDDSAGELVREAIAETRELVRLEVALAREEIKTELARAKAGAIAIAVAATAAVCGFTLCLVAIAAAFSAIWLAALIIGAILLAGAGAAALLGWKAVPKRPMGSTRERLQTDVKQLRERIA
jgi:hypothetical protein